MLVRDQLIRIREITGQAEDQRPQFPQLGEGGQELRGGELAAERHDGAHALERRAGRAGVDLEAGFLRRDAVGGDG